MTNAELEEIFKQNINISYITALRAVYNQGWYEGAGQTPTAASPDKSKAAAKPTAIIRHNSRID